LAPIGATLWRTVRSFAWARADHSGAQEDAVARSTLVIGLVTFAAASCSAAGGDSPAASGGAGGGASGGAQDAGVLDTGSDVSLDAATYIDVSPDAANGPKGCPGQAQSFIWIANTGEGTLSKVCTTSGEEVARYVTSPQGATGDPSRTSVNLHGDMVVTNRSPQPGPSSVTKFAADVKDCVDRNSNGQIDTSTGPTDVRAWGEDECMIWNTPLGGGMEIGARATAWDGTEDSKTGLGGMVFIGAMTNKTVYKINGDTGAILEQAVTANAHYGGAIDGKRNLWTVSMMCPVGMCTVERISLDKLTDHEMVNVHCGYGISVDAKNRVWTSGQNMFAGGGCVTRYDPDTKKMEWVNTGATDFNRGIAIGTGPSAGSAWSASTNGELIQVDLEALKVVKRQAVGVSSMVGVAIDFEGNVWTVSQGGNAAHKVNPVTWDVVNVPIGSQPYTYSDMTGMQLRNVKPPPK
jgi:hypothetical protein